MQHLRVLNPLLLALALTACGGSAGGVAATSPADAARVELSEQELRKLDPRLVERMRDEEAGALPVKVRFVTVPSDAELADLLLTRVGAVVVGSVTPPVLKRIAKRPDVAEITWFAGAGYDDTDDGA